MSRQQLRLIGSLICGGLFAFSVYLVGSHHEMTGQSAGYETRLIVLPRESSAESLAWHTAQARKPAAVVSHSSAQQSLASSVVKSKPAKKSVLLPVKQSSKKEKPKVRSVHVRRHSSSAMKPLPAKSSKKNSYSLQVASYQSSQNANLMQQKLQKMGYHSRVKVLRLSGKTWYRLLVVDLKTARQVTLVQSQIHRVFGLVSTRLAG